MKIISEKLSLLHYTDPYILNPTHKITINVIGIGGTGSLLLTKLAMLDVALRGIGHPGLFVQAWDGDKITTANVGRQLFYSQDVGLFKADVMISRINLAFGNEWKAYCYHWGKSHHTNYGANFMITCTDTVKSRQKVLGWMNKQNSNEPYAKTYYWIDAGNKKNIGQVIMGTRHKIPQPKGMKGANKLPNVFDIYPELKTGVEDNDTPSCSLTEALEKQDLFINSFMADWIAHLMWTMFRYGKTDKHGVFVNLDSWTTNPLYINK